MPESVGDLAEQPWQDVWNSDTAQAIRTSIHDGSYRYCNKTACPLIAGGKLPTKAQASATSPVTQAILDRTQTLLPSSPRRVNLAYDMTCNLSCPQLPHRYHRRRPQSPGALRQAAGRGRSSDAEAQRTGIRHRLG
ncbi:MAG: SPASM domain-containing protein [Alphaproteobacteria bacterium]